MNWEDFQTKTKLLSLNAHPCRKVEETSQGSLEKKDLMNM